MEIKIVIDDKLLNRLKLLVSKKSTRLTLLVITFLSAGLLYATDVVKPNTFNSGDIISSAQINENFDVLYAKINALKGGSGSPAGTILPFAGDKTKLPDGWLLCDGSEISRSDYANLFNVIGENYGYGDQSNTFNLPDLRGVFLRGQNDGSGKDPNADPRTALKPGGNTGDLVGSFQGEAIGPHNHVYTDYYTGDSEAVISGSISSNSQAADSGDGAYLRYYNNSTKNSTGSETRPKNVSVIYIIKY